MTNITEITGALSWYMQADAALSTALAACDDSPGYYCQRFYQERDQAAQDLKSALDAYIDDRIEAATGARP